MSGNKDSSHSGQPLESGGPSQAEGTGPEGGGGRQWSNPLPLKEAVARSPVLVQLEDGSRGAVEALSFSQGDVMALEGEICVKDRRLVLAHFTTEMENEDGEKEEESIYRSLLSIPWEHLPEVDVRVCLDSEGLAYSNFVSTHFPQCNWRQQQQQLLDDMEDSDYDNIREITPVPLPTPKKPPQAPKERRPPPPPPSSEPSPPTPLSQKSPSTPRRPPPVPPRVSSRDNVGKGTRAQVEADDTPPPRPPKPKSQSSSPNPASSASKPEALFPSELAEQDASDSSVYEFDHNYLQVMGDDDDEDVDDDVYIDLKEPRKAAAVSPEPKRKPEKDKTTPKKDKKEEKKDSTKKEEKKESIKVCSFGKQEKKDSTKKEEKKESIKVCSFGKQEKKDSPTDAAKTVPVKPTVRVPPLTSQPTSPTQRAPMMSPVKSSPEEKSDSDNEEYCYDLPSDFGLQVHKMTCRQLCARLRLCGMPDLATACDSNRLDGAFFFSLSEDDLRKPPFSLNDFDISIKLQKVKSGWIPK